ncbi:LAGLIDADG family homing endonuclease [Streptomyces sp. MB09-02B]|uniref:LAGLIDADG family homing endonuclease n=1 Tax=Streptomyces sp. MB09-02B TaxID=3028667 RepID=UPI0029AA4213|nr:LAGLIDADG family homing endonuclease [Streptomyces sp. MB09-02B]MDX3643910.1 LAGLIDADG family homing endonuclease [Streptomyces sp. MB09-02B]
MADGEPSAHEFMDLTVSEYAYMFGFLQADGHLYQGEGRKGRLTVELSVQDIDLLYRFKYLTPYNSRVTERVRSTNFADSHHSATWSLCSLEARTKLNQLGLPYGRKSKTIAPPRVAFSRRDYLRGLIDADGAVGYTGSGWPFICLATASTAIVAFVRSYAQEITGVERLARRNTRDEIYNITFEKEAAQELTADLYYPGCLSLGRKQVKADSVSHWARPADMRIVNSRRAWTAYEDRMVLDQDDIVAVATELGRTENSCRRRRWRLRNSRMLMPNDQ